MNFSKPLSERAVDTAMTTTTHDHTDPRTFDREDDVYHVYYEQADPASVCTKLVFALSSLTDDDPTTLSPVYYAVEPDALEALVKGQARGAELSFAYEGYLVTVRDDGRISFSPQE